MAVVVASVIILVFVKLCSSTIVPYTEKYHEQFVDHFSFYWKPYGKNTFKQRYLVQDKWWTNGKGPIFFYTGNEGPITAFWQNTGFMFDIAPQFNALIVFAEHRFYGKSLPFGPEVSFTHPYVDLLTIEQAMADFAGLIKHLKESLNATRCPVIAFGGSYGGMLSAYMRFKYPNLVAGSLAASAPIYQVAGQTSRHLFFSDVTRDFTNARPNCSETVREAFRQMNEIVTSGSAGLKTISKSFQLCSPLKNMAQYRHLLGWVRNSFTQMAMMDYPYATKFMANLPGHPVKVACKKLVENSDPVRGLAEAAAMAYGDPKCSDIWKEFVECADPTGCGVGPDSKAWDYQACTEIIMPAGSDNITDMFPPLPFSLQQRRAYCEKTWGVTPRDNWLNTLFWGKNIKHASNIVFSNGMLDPWRRGGVLESVSESVVAIVMDGAAHHLDLREANEADPDAVRIGRLVETQHISRWIKQGRRQSRPPGVEPLQPED